MSEEEIKKLQDDLKTAQDALKTEQEGRAADATAHEKAIKEKDQVIAVKNADLIGARREYGKKLQDMTDAEKAALSQTELELKKQAEDLEASQAAFQKEQREARQKDVDARRAAAIRKFAGTDAELTKKIEDNYARIKDAADAQTEEEIARVAGEAFNMLGIPKPDAVRSAVNGEGAAPDNGGSGANFADTAEGKSLAQMMGLPVEAPKPAETTPPAA